jgi:DNA-binding NarL/FixJ family response regulator
MNATILIADDNEFMRWAIRHLLSKSRPEWVVCGEATNGKDAVSAAQTLQPDVVILDESMPGMTGVQAASKLAKLRVDSRVLLLSAYEQKDMNLAAESAGLQGYRYVDKATAGRDLVPAVEELLFEADIPDCT